MEPAGLLTLAIKSQSKNYEKYEEDEKIEILSFKQAFESNVSTITNLSLQGNSYSKVFCEQFSKHLKNASRLENVNFNDLFVSRKKDELSDSVKFLSDALIGKKIQRLDISNNALGPSGALALSDFLLQASDLRVLLINNCGLGIDGVTTISNSLKTGAPNLEVWAMSRNRAENPGAQKVGEALSGLKKLKELHVFQNVIRLEGMMAIVTALQGCPDLEVLDVRDNYVKGEAAKEMGVLIEKSQNLKALNLSDCNMEKEENEFIIKAFENSKVNLERLGYNYNELNEAQAKRLLDSVLKDDKKLLKRLDIKGNEFKKSTKTYFKEKLQTVGLEKALSAFESGESDNEDELAKNFSDLKI